MKVTIIILVSLVLMNNSSGGIQLLLCARAHENVSRHARSTPAGGTVNSVSYHSMPRRSSFTCTGSKWGDHSRNGCSYCRTCRFDNVCLNLSSHQLQYYTGSERIPLFYDDGGCAQQEFPVDFVETGHSSIAPRMHWAPTTLVGDIPPEATFNDAPVVAYVSLNDFAGNFGHALFDFLFPVFNALDLTNAYRPDFQLLLAKHQGGNEGVLYEFVDPPLANRSLLALISNKHAMTIDTLVSGERAKGAGVEVTCFSSFVVGSGGLHTSEQRIEALPFRTAAFSNMGILEKRQVAPKITMLIKKGRRAIENAEAIMHRLKAKYVGVEFETLQGEAVVTMSIKEQLQAMSKTSILITPCGGTGTVLTFLPPGASAVVMNFWQSVAGRSEQMESLYYWNIEYLDIQYFPILLEDYEETKDRPACEKPADDPFFEQQGALIHCNVHIKDLSRLENVITNALQRWTNDHTRVDTPFTVPDKL